MTSLPESRIETDDWPMWAGTADDLQRIFKVIQKQYASLIPTHVEAKLRHPREMLQYAEDRRERLAKEAAQYGTDSSLAARISENESDINKRTEDLDSAQAGALAAGNIRLSLSGLNGDRTTVTGTAPQLIEYIDGKRFKSFEASAPSGDIRARSITVGADRESGIDLRVSSDDAVWCRAAFSELSEEIQKHVPRWKFIRSNAFLLIFYNLLNLLVLLLLAAMTPRDGRTDFLTGLISVGVSVLIAVTVIVVLTTISRRYMPAFDLVATGNQPKGVSFMKFWAYTVGVSLVLAVVGNAITKVMLG